MTRILQLAGALALLAIAGLFLTLSWVAAQVPRKIDGIRADVNDHMLFLRSEASRQIGDARKDLFIRSEVEIAALRTEALLRVDTGLSVLDRRTGEALTVADSRAQQALSAIDGLRADVRPTLAAASGILKDAQDSWDDLYPDVKGSVASATVAVTSAAQASEAVRDAAPKLSESVIGIGKSVDGITADIHTVTSDFVKPKTFWQRVKGWLSLGATAGARLL